MQKYSLVIVIAVLLLAGCETTTVTPQFAGVVHARVGPADSETFTSHKLTKNGQFASGFDYGDPNVVDWKATIQWSLLASQNAADTYRLNWIFTPASGASVSGTSDVDYDGKNKVVTVANDQLTITIEPETAQNAG